MFELQYLCVSAVSPHTLSCALLFQSVVLHGLRAFTNYSVRVAVANDDGTGPFSEALTGVSCDGGELCSTPDAEVTKTLIRQSEKN